MKMIGLWPALRIIVLEVKRRVADKRDKYAYLKPVSRDLKMCQEELRTLFESIQSIPSDLRIIAKGHNSRVGEVFREVVLEPERPILMRPSAARVSTKPVNGNDTENSVRISKYETENKQLTQLLDLSPRLES
jgi:hypothetical protein